jgi:hypothetical protein
MIVQLTVLIDTEKPLTQVAKAAVKVLEKAGAKVREAAISDRVEPERFDFMETGGGVRTEPETVMPFGMYKGQPMEDVPAKYLDYLAGETWIGIWPGVLAYIEANRVWLDKELDLED